ncbi:MAG: sigma-54 dependent transcriptional regulator [Acidobacteria bacterium]|nr:sigma-54 dependent transcriptional regulator [Acidobacteriota bacterium]
MARARILVVDDEEGVRTSLMGILRDEGYLVETAESGEKCLELLGKNEYQAVFLDVWMPGKDGMEILTEATARPGAPAVVMISGHGTIETAVKAAKMGAYDFIEKPLSLEKVTLTLRNALKQRRLEEKNRLLKEELSQDETLVGDSPPIRRLREEIALAAPTHGRVLILGENGTGKELVARMIHSRSLRKDEPFVEVNCAAIPEELIESELFGHMRGAFTGAVENKRGKFDLADGGTLLLDEIGDMSLRTQAKVLRVLQEQTFEPVGGAGTTRQVDVRVIAATNKDLAQSIARGEFREDLYFRLNVIPLMVPPLRERREDIPALTRHFLQRFGAEYGRKREAAPEALEALKRYDWPGNVRELRNTLERMVIMTGTSEIRLEDLPAAVRGQGRETNSGSDAYDGTSLKKARAAFERQFITHKLQEVGGNVARAAELLGVERSHLYRKLKAYGIKEGT